MIALGAGAVIPPLILLIFIYAKDPHEKEPMGLLIKIFICGVISCIPAALYEGFGQSVLKELNIDDAFFYNLIMFFGIVGVAEECVKYFALYVCTWKNRNFNYRFDGIVYAVFASLGFATLENILYVYRSGFDTAIARALLSIPGHCNFAIYMGYFYGQAKYLEAIGDIKGSASKRRTGLIVAILLHGTYDFCISMYTTTREGVYIVAFFGFVIMLDIMAFVRVHRSSKQETPHQYIHESNLVGAYQNTYTAPAPQRGQFGQPQQQPYVQQQYGAYQNAYRQQPNSYSYQQPNQLYQQQPYQTYQQPYQQQTYQQQPVYQQPAQGMVFCTYCGSQCRSNSFYCSSCGKPLYKV